VDAVDRHRPGVAGDVPVQLVERGLLAVRKEKADRVGDAVADDDLPVGVARIRNVDVESVRPAVVQILFIYLESPAASVGDVADRDVEPRGAALCGVVVERQVAIDSVPVSGESERDLLGDVERPVGVNGEQRVEYADADGAFLRAREMREREEDESECSANG
jgi:hypothetical protein